MRWSQLDCIEVDTDLIWVKTFSLLYLKVDVIFIAGCWAWLGCYHEYGTYVTIFHTYLEIPM
jgi:hypothetical protein